MKFCLVVPESVVDKFMCQRKKERKEEKKNNKKKKRRKNNKSPNVVWET